MRSVVAEPCHWTILAFMEILDADRLEDAQAVDGTYHAAKLTAAAFGEPKRIWEEHAEMRARLLTPGTERKRHTFDEVVAIHQRMKSAGLVH